MKQTLILISFFLTISACGNKEKQVEITEATSSEAKITLVTTPEVFQSSFYDVTTAYLELKDHFVATDSDQAKTAAHNMLDKVSAIGTDNLTAEASQKWSDFKSTLTTELETIAATSSVKDQRTAFFPLSNAMESAVKAFGRGERPIYKQYCPMAFNNTGATWLSEEKQIRNPYFGDRMLKCGSVKEQI